MLKLFKTYVSLPALVVTCFITGCGGDGGFDGPVGTVSGKVTFQGKPLPEGSTVLFKHDKSGQVATGTLSATDGSFRLRWRGSYDVLAGGYKVAFSTGGSSTPIELPADPNALAASQDYEKMMSGGAETNAPTDTAPAIPPKFLSHDTTDEVFDVQPGDNTYEFDIP